MDFTLPVDLLPEQLEMLAEEVTLPAVAGYGPFHIPLLYLVLVTLLLLVLILRRRRRKRKRKLAEKLGTKILSRKERKNEKRKLKLSRKQARLDGKQRKKDRKRGVETRTVRDNVASGGKSDHPESSPARSRKVDGKKDETVTPVVLPTLPHARKAPGDTGTEVVEVSYDDLIVNDIPAEEPAVRTVKAKVSKPLEKEPETIPDEDEVEETVEDGPDDVLEMENEVFIGRLRDEMKQKKDRRHKDTVPKLSMYLRGNDTPVDGAMDRMEREIMDELERMTEPEEVTLVRCPRCNFITEVPITEGPKEVVCHRCGTRGILMSSA